MSSSQSSLDTRGYLLLLVTVFGWGISWPFLKIALTEIPPWTFRGLIAPTAAILVFGIGALLRYDLGKPTGLWKEITLAAILNITCWHVFSAFGIKLLGGGQASIIAYTMPLWAVVFSAWFIEEKLTSFRLIGLIAGMAGLAVLLSGEVGILASSPLGALFMLIAACAWGAGTTLQKKVDWNISSVSLVGWQLLIGGLPITIIALLVDAGSWKPVSQAAVWSTIFVLIYPIILCWFAWFTIVDQVPVAVSTISILSVPVLGVGSSVLVLQEVVGWREIVSLLLICAAIALVLKPVSDPKT